MTTQGPSDRTLPPEAAFVLQFQSGVDVPAGRFAGRVEHVTSGRATRFDSVPELLAFITRVLAAGVLAPSPDTQSRDQRKGEQR